MFVLIRERPRVQGRYPATRHEHIALLHSQRVRSVPASCIDAAQFKSRDHGCLSFRASAGEAAASEGLLRSAARLAGPAHAAVAPNAMA